MSKKVKYKKVGTRVKCGKLNDIKTVKKWSKLLKISETTFEFYAFQNGFEKQ